MDITDKDIKSLCHDVGLNDDITGKIVSSYRTRTDAGVKIYLATRGNGVTANYIAKRLGIKSRTIYTEAFKRSERKMKWPEETRDFYKKNREKEYKLTGLGKLYIKSLEEFDGRYPLRDVAKEFKKPKKLEDIKYNSHRIKAIMELLDLNFIKPVD